MSIRNHSIHIAGPNINKRAATNYKHCPNISKYKAQPAALDSITKLLRIQLYLDQYNYDEIVIGFNSGAKTTYDFNEDSKYLPGINAPEGLSSYSSDGVPLSINLVPLPKQHPEIIKLNVEAENSGPFTFKRTQLDQIPQNYNIWLKDNYKKDSVNLRLDSNYAFIVNKADSATFGSSRFSVVINQEPTPAFKLLDFNVTKAATGAQIFWNTQNETNSTTFAIERSNDGGVIFETLDCLKSSASGNYSYTDNNPPAASDEYRLKITDLNGAVTFSNTVTVIFGNTTKLITGNISIFPNPTSNMINIAINQGSNNNSASTLTTQSTSSFLSLAANTNLSYSINIVSISGGIIKTVTSSAAIWQGDIVNLLPGTYIITVINNNDKKLVGRSTFVKL
ncbi:hypothetical protein [Mucilaginibacter sp.]|uniref:hypothetical protein n=1 Tax=Mucilaginibacter sp. TaxID=1882438 RepID=UPI00284F3BED|nr:hypothetical protein [Mucilaginibacter sp.]MDR3693254.1 hypothetical protein [Mucilaginibacter sp.]